MSDVVADVLAERGVVPENVVSLSVFAFGCRDGFVTEGVMYVSEVLLSFRVTRSKDEIH